MQYLRIVVVLYGALHRPVLGVEPWGSLSHITKPVRGGLLAGAARESLWPSQLIITPTHSCLIVLAAPGICHNWILVSGMEELNNQIAVCLYLFIY